MIGQHSPIDPTAAFAAQIADLRARLAETERALGRHIEDLDVSGDLAVGGDLAVAGGLSVAGHPVPKVAAGGVSVSFSSSANSTAGVTFPAGLFSSTPRVVATVTGVAGLAGSTIRVSGASSSGCTIALTLTTSQTAVHVVDWVAVEEI